MSQSAVLFDGTNAVGREVMIEAEGASLVLRHGDGRIETLAGAPLTIDDGPGKLRLGRRDRPGWSVVLPRPVAPDIAALLPLATNYGAWVDRFGIRRTLAIGAVVTAALLVLGYSAPDWLAPMISPAAERRIGATLVGDFAEERCASPSGERALQALVARLDPAAVQRGDHRIRIMALDFKMLNAMAMPGNTVIVLRGAIDETDADALAGILAHEIAHVRRRHVMKALIREFGIGAVINLFGGDLGANAQQLMSLSYTRHDEAEADSDAIAMLARAGISPLPTARLFDKLARDEDEAGGMVGEFLSSHPMSADRARRFARSYDPKRAYRPALPATEAKALDAICAGN